MELSNRDRLKEMVRRKLRERSLKTDEQSTTASVDGYNTPFAFGRNTQGDKERKAKASGTGYELAEAKKRLAEVERFLGWYNKLKLENGVKNEDFYNKTNVSILCVKERLNKIAKQL